MEINKIQNGDQLTLEVSGRLDTVTAPDLQDELDKSLDGIAHLVLDFKNLEYISSAGLRVVLAAQKEMNRLGDMRVINSSPDVVSIFEMTGFSDFLTLK